jgi:hypothetical protein
MINKGEGQLSKRHEKTKRKSRWNKGKRGLSHHFSKILLKENQPPKSLE